LETLIFLKPECGEDDRLLYGITRLISKNRLGISLKKDALPNKKFWTNFYSKDVGADYFEEMIQYLLSSKTIFFVLKGDDNIIELAREQVRHERAKRGKSSSDIKNFLHASDSKENAEREIKLVREFFSKK
jgi:nucleoside diphosphate kinase